MKSISELRHVHIVGVGGTLMGAFAAFLKRSGIRVTGSDGPIYPPMSDVLKDAGVEVFTGYDASHLTGTHRPDLVVIGNVVRKDNPEAVAAMQGGLSYTSLPEAMERLLLKDTRNVVVAGTHGKTTTSSLMSHVLREAGKKPSWFIGGVSHDLPVSFHVELGSSSGSPFVLEGDEYDTAFWDKVPKFNHYLPDDAILTSIEYDHADIYDSLASVEKAFQGLLQRIRPGGRLIACIDFPSVAQMVRGWNARPLVTYSRSEKSGADYWVESIETRNGVTHFRLAGKKEFSFEAHLSIPGDHNVMNALAVTIECLSLGLSPEQIRAGFASFRGVKRRQEERGEVRGVLVLDDFAHHPTAVRETLKALHTKYPERRLVAVFEPRSATSRRKVFQAEYAAAFDSASSSFIAQPYEASKIQSADQFSSDQLISDMKARGVDAHLLPVEVDAAVKVVAQAALRGDLVAVLSNGGFGGFIPKLLEQLAAKS